MHAETAKAIGDHLFMADLSLATAARTSVMMLPGPIPFTLILWAARESAIHLQPAIRRISTGR